MRSLFGSRYSVVAAALATTAVAMALGASSALAAPVPATWTATGSAQVSGQLTVTKDNAEAKTCSLSTSGSVFNEAGQGKMFLGGTGVPTAFCSGGPPDLQIDQLLAGQWESSSGYSLMAGGEFLLLESPYGSYYSKQYSVIFKNGSGGTKSTYTYNKTLIGYTSFPTGAIRVSGTLTMTDGKTGTRTLTH